MLVEFAQTSVREFADPHGFLLVAENAPVVAQGRWDVDAARRGRQHPSGLDAGHTQDQVLDVRRAPLLAFQLLERVQGQPRVAVEQSGPLRAGVTD